MLNPNKGRFSYAKFVESEIMLQTHKFPHREELCSKILKWFEGTMDWQVLPIGKPGNCLIIVS